MPPIPDSFRILKGEELEKASSLHATLVRRTWADGLVPVDGETRGRCVHEAGGIVDLSTDHLSALIAGAAKVGESDVVVFDQAAVEVNLNVLLDFCESTDFELSSGDDWHVPEALTHWPTPAKKALAPLFVDGWALMSPTGKWTFASYGSDDDTWITGSQSFLDAYLEVRPGAVYDVLLWMHGEGSFLTTGTVYRPRKSLWRFVAPLVAERELVYEAAMKPTLERFYSPEDANWIWEAFVASENALEFPMFIGWDDRVERLMEYFKSDPTIEERLTAIWRGN